MQTLENNCDFGNACVAFDRRYPFCDENGNISAMLLEMILAFIPMGGRPEPENEMMPAWWREKLATRLPYDTAGKLE